MNGLAFLIDAPGPDDLIELDVAEGTKTSQVQIAKVGSFKDPRYGKFAITLADFSKWIANFAALSKAGGRAGLPIDVDHGPERTGNTEAAGWITELVIKGKELWATAEWNSLGQELVGDRRYLYLSPAYQHDYVDEAGTKHGPALVGVGLTNRPFLSMATVSLSVAEPGFAVEEVPEPDPSDSRERTMTLLAELIKTLSLADDATEADVTAKIAELQTKPDPKKPETKSLDQLAGEAGKVVLDAATFTTLKANADSGAAAAKELHDSKFETAFATALSEGRVTPAQKENFTALYEADSAATLTMLGALPVAITLTAAGGGGGSAGADNGVSAKDAEGNPVDEDRAALHAKAVTLAAEKKIDYGEAVLLVSQEG